MLNHLQASFGVTTTYVDATRPEEFARAVTPQTKLAVVETISNPLMEVADLPAIVAALGEVPLLVDSTFATPCLSRPLEHGARLVFHSASKYLNGHGDVMLGVIVGQARRRSPGARTGGAVRRQQQPVRVLAGVARPADAALADAARFRDRRANWPASWQRTRRWRASITPGSRSIPATPRRGGF